MPEKLAFSIVKSHLKALQRYLATPATPSHRYLATQVEMFKSVGQFFKRLVKGCSTKHILNIYNLKISVN